MASDPRDAASPHWDLANEFGAVRLRVDRRGAAPRLLVEDLASGRTAAFDAFQLAALVDASPAELAALMDPGPRSLGEG